MLTVSIFSVRIQEHCKKMGLQLSWLERTPDKGEVDGSSPFRPTINCNTPSQLSRQSNRLLTDRSQVRALYLAPFGLLEKRLNSHPFHGCIHGFESRKGHQILYSAGLAQLVEQLTCNQQVVGSSPIASTILF